MTQKLPIGVFDSGIGGLTVLSELISQLPGESFIYLGDTARLPYGTKSPETVTRYALGAAQFLMSRGIKLLVVACNTASATALPALRQALAIPVLGVVEPAAQAAARMARRVVGIIGTESTVASGVYQKLLSALRPELKLLAQACPLFVPLAEEGWFDHPITHQVAEVYLHPLREAEVDTVVLGCTHYPLLARPIAQALGPEVALINAGREVARQAGELLLREGLLAGQREGEVTLLVTDAAPRVRRLAAAIIPAVADRLELVDLTETHKARRSHVGSASLAG
ncbi:MAG: glutamate racemase [Thermoanaerobaculum sp.]|uniref:Glutamate racemase n=1 Tax=Thermoanaerobaculum aquaticum TaxID=1312852 RepID=A0A7V1ZH93_9BACT|nr:MAG: glutamate racemase [Thermoanaerobaculum sp.]